MPADHYCLVEIQGVEKNELSKEKRTINYEKRAQKISALASGRVDWKKPTRRPNPCIWVGV
jgi:hypothetical protein